MNLQTYVERLLKTYRPSKFEAFSLAFMIFALGVLGRVLLDMVVPGRLPFISFFPTVLFAALLCGLYPSLMVLLLAGIAGTLWIESSGHSVTYHLTGFVVFTSVGFSLVVLFEALRRAYFKLAERDAQLALLNDELNHRIRNLFTVASALAAHTILNGSSPKEMVRSLNGRFAALATSHTLQGVGEQANVALNSLVTAVVKPLAPEASRLVTKGPEVCLPSETAANMALVLNELATNALKYGAWSADQGTVHVIWEQKPTTIILSWNERDGPTVNVPVSTGAGSTLIQNAVIGATVDYHLAPDGVRCSFEIALGDSSPSPHQDGQIGLQAPQ